MKQGLGDAEVGITQLAGRGIKAMFGVGGGISRGAPSDVIQAAKRKILELGGKEITFT